jgi:glycosyltransferase involved in cell wall biosynthesis
MPQLYRQSDIFISATMQEGMSNAMLEAMASGLPIVTTRCEGVDELITDNGVVVDHNADAASLAEAIKKLINDRELLGRMSLSARKRAELFSWRNVAEKYLRHYERIRPKK